ncbi:hypothetical protein PSECIP111951_02491 [Pseudoalteromonas holothuriae]|uniref:Uncharacterized protein n=1 Tax=Pseudoalteromonas holothuriae TaxID=2963714 RepID=A0A9W4QU82_9GAMM|nr:MULTISPECIES: hypothetical protein [unclassified Pseudoalteromonas]CAH9053342.1 hypothetical protein PSECIP111854_01151 [Pseudoalteromonas sp. CIP111854]CAH9061443.1 hypothetical protein PSECIP111951_02491 [Pseudoalteromonas sp. CIP111951]
MNHINQNKTPLSITVFTAALMTLLSACGGSGSGGATDNTVKKAKNQLPNVIISAVTEIESGAEVYMTSSASDPDGTVTNYQWSQKSGYAVTIRDKNQANASFTAPVLDADTTLELELLVRDDKGGEAKDTFSITVKRAVQAQSSYDSCNVELARSVLDTYKQTMNFESKIALKKWLCSAPSLQDHDFAKSVSNIFSLDDNNVDLDEWRAAHCSGDDINFADSKSSHVLLHTASEKASSTWTQCMQSTNALACYATHGDRTLPDNKHSVVLNINVKADSGKLLNTDIVATNLTTVDSVPSALESGKTQLHYKLNDANSEAHFEISGNTNNENVSCVYSMPTKPTIEADTCEVFRTQSFVQGKLSERDYEHLKETDQVPLFSSNDGNLVGHYSCSLYRN